MIFLPFYNVMCSAQMMERVCISEALLNIIYQIHSIGLSTVHHFNGNQTDNLKLVWSYH